MIGQSSPYTYRLKMDRFRWLVLPSLMLLYSAGTVSAATLTVKSSTTQARKGQPFKVYLVIAAQEDMDEINIAMVPPTGFLVESPPDTPRSLASGSSFTAVYTLMPPSTWHQNSPGSDTREQKIVVFNVSYASLWEGKSKKRNESANLSVDYSTSPPLYLLLGLVGAILGNLIKSVTAQEDRQQSLWQSLRSSFTAGKGGLITSVAIAFVVLLLLSRDAIPTKGWYDSLALGAAIAVFSDEQLLSKIKKVVPT